jgi:hypothetical protein
MKPGCKTSLWVIAGLAVVWFAAVGRFFAFPLSVLGAVGGGISSALFIGGVVTARRTLRSAQTLASDSSAVEIDHRPPVDGKITTIVGRIRAVGEPLRSPMTRRPCVYYRYEISRTAATPDHNVKHGSNAFAGVAFTSCVIDSQHGSVRLMGVPELQGFPLENPKGPAEHANARAYIDATEFVRVDGAIDGMGATVREVTEQLAHAEASHRTDWQMVDKSIDVENSTLREEIIPIGEEICAIGVYSAAERALVPDLRQGSRNRLIKGGARTGVWALRRQALGQLLGGLLLAVMGNVGVVMFLLMNQ